jgi:CheY-like chemotaxis protein
MPRKIKILLVEDNEDERIFMKEGFISTGLYEVVAEAGNGEEMLQLLKEPSFSMPEMVLSDLNMPGKNGYEVIKDVCSSYSRPNIPVVILSSAPYVPYAERCKKIGACAFFTKPDTFLEYEDFAKSIYSQLLNSCLKGA